MKVVKINDEMVLFDNGSKITFDHDQDCCECNYADFEQLNDTGIEKENFSEPLTFEEAGEYGFRFGNPGKMYYVPCYSLQNGYYTNAVDIYYNDKVVLNLAGEWIED
jgi:hypothetical protein